MTESQDISAELQHRVKEAANSGTTLQIVGGGTKSFYGRSVSGIPLSVSSHCGIISYEPGELVLSARSGTPLADIEEVLAASNQMLAFEPPHMGDSATLGGAIATGLSGPRRPYSGAARDFVLGIKLINGSADVMRFGGQVMKNVAGYDVSRLMAGALGTLGILLEISLKVLPRPAAEQTLVQHRTPDDAIEAMNAWAGRPLPLSGCCYDGNRLYVRLSGTQSAVRAAHAKLGGETLPDASAFWKSLREQRSTFFDGPLPLWRLAVPAACAPMKLSGKWLLDWGGAQRWLRSDGDASVIRQAAAQVGGHATLFRGGDRGGEVFHPLAPELLALHRRIKEAMDPQHIFNPGRMYLDL